MAEPTFLIHGSATPQAGKPNRIFESVLMAAIRWPPNHHENVDMDPAPPVHAIFILETCKLQEIFPPRRLWNF